MKEGLSIQDEIIGILKCPVSRGLDARCDMECLIEPSIFESKYGIWAVALLLGKLEIQQLPCKGMKNRLPAAKNAIERWRASLRKV